MNLGKLEYRRLGIYGLALIVNESSNQWRFEREVLKILHTLKFSNITSSTVMLLTITTTFE